MLVQKIQSVECRESDGTVKIRFICPTMMREQEMEMTIDEAEQLQVKLDAELQRRKP